MIPTAHPRPQIKNGIPIGSAVFAQTTVECLYTLQWDAHSLPKNCPFPLGGSGPPSNTWFPGPTQILNPNGSSIGAAVFAGLTSVTDRPIDRPTDHATGPRSTSVPYQNWHVDPSSRLATIDMGQNWGGGCSAAWSEAYLSTKWHLVKCGTEEWTLVHCFVLNFTLICATCRPCGTMNLKIAL